MVKLDKEKMSQIGKSNSRRGKSQERRVAKLLTEWTGHIIPVSKQAIFSIEVKNASGFSLDALMSNPKTTKFTSWWFQSSYDALLMTNYLQQDIYPFLFFKPIPAWDWVAFPTCLIKNNILQSSVQNTTPGKIWFSAIRFDTFSQIGPISMNISQSKNPVMKSLQLSSCYICRWKDFANNIDPKSIFLDYAKPPAAVL